jgi:arylformamidase
MPIWPGDPAVELEQVQQIEAGDPVNVSVLRCGVHSGTHVDAPWHFLPQGTTSEHLSLDVLIGPAVVAYLPDAAVITAHDLEQLHLPAQTTRLLLRTRNSERWTAGEQQFSEDFVALSADAAQWIVERDIRLVGIDYLSIQRYHDGPETHQILLTAGVIIIETLNLAGVEPGQYELLCLPILLVGAEAALARAVLREL